MNSNLAVSRTSRRYKHILTILLYSVPIFYLFIWLFIDRLPSQLGYLNHSYEVVGGYTWSMRLLGFTASMLKGAVVMYGLSILVKLFGLYEEGTFFASENVKSFKTFSNALIWWVIAGIVATPLISMILTMNNPPGQHVLAVTFQSADLTALIVGGILRVVAGVMENAKSLQEEAELTI